MGLSEEQLKNVCKLGKGGATCSFLGVIPGSGFSCLKRTSMEAIIRERRGSGKMAAKGDNCSGPPDFMSQESDSKEDLRKRVREFAESRGWSKEEAERLESDLVDNPPLGRKEYEEALKYFSEEWGVSVEEVKRRLDGKR